MSPAFAQERTPYNPPATPLPAVKQAASSAAENAIADFRVPDGTVVSLVAAEPLLANPVAIEVDFQGRIYVAETYRQETEGVPDNRTFPEWLQEDLKLQTVEQRAAMMLDYHPEFATEWIDHDDRIQVLIDEDGDGIAETSRIFAHGFHDLLDGTGAGLLAHGKDIYYTCIPKLWKLTDADFDGVAETGEALHHGFGVRVAFRGHDMHGLVLGPLRKLYFSIGDRGYHVVNDEGELLAEPGRGAVFRCDLDGGNLEVFAHGLRNPQEIAFDDFGNLFTVDNNCDAGDSARLVHVIEGGDSGWRMNFQYLSDRGPWMSESWWKPAADAQNLPAFLNAPLANITSGPSGLAAYPGVGLGPGMEGSFFVCDFLGGTSYSGIRRFTVEADGASFRLGEEEEYWWGILATDVCFEPSGSMVVSDWVRSWVGEGFGRIYRASSSLADQNLMHETATLLASDFTQMEPARLLSLLAHPDRRVRFQAQWELADQNQSALLAALAKSFPAAQIARLHAMWGLGMISPNDENDAALITLCSDPDPQIRIQALRMLRETGTGELGKTLDNLLIDENLQVRMAAVYFAGSRGADTDQILSALERDGGESRALMQGVAWALAEQGLSGPWKTKEVQRNPLHSLASVLALRRLKRVDALQAYLAVADARVASEAACAIYDLGLYAGFSALASRLVDAQNLPLAMQRRAAAAANFVGGATEAQLLLDFVSSSDIDDGLRTEVQTYIRDWDRPAEFDIILNESQPFPLRESDWFVGKELSFPTARDLDAVARGREVFSGHALAACTRCHSVRGITPPGFINPAGPDLSAIGLALNKEELRQSILNPSASIARGFEIKDSDGRVLPVSTMPPNFGDLLSHQELEDVIAFLALQKQERQILVHVNSQGYEHAVAKAGEDGLSLVERSWMKWAEEDARFSVTVDRSYQRFSTEGLSEFDAVFFYTTGELPMSDTQKTAFLDFVTSGGVFVGSHCASDTFYNWPAYGLMLGAYFDGHPWHQEVQLQVEETAHPATQSLQSGFAFTDEIYQFGAPYNRDRLSVLLSLDVTSVPMELDSIHRIDQDFALSWERKEGDGGVFYTALGHRPELWRSSWFRDHLVEGTLAVCNQLQSAAIDEPAETAKVRPSSFTQEFAPNLEMEFVPITNEEGSTIWMSTTEVTWDLYDRFFLREDEQIAVDGITGPSRSVFPVTRGFGHDGFPALGMTHHAAKEFCTWVSQDTGHRFRLPSEEEWRYAAGVAPGEKALPSLGWFSDNADNAPHAVAYLEANAFGLYDMFGNVAEWVTSDAPKGVALGGSYLSDADQVGPDARQPYTIQWQDRDPQWPKSRWWMSDGGFVGFRLVTLEIPADQSHTRE